MPPNRFESEVESFLEGSHGDRTHIKRADHHTVTPLCGTLLLRPLHPAFPSTLSPKASLNIRKYLRAEPKLHRVQITNSYPGYVGAANDIGGYIQD